MTKTQLFIPKRIYTNPQMSSDMLVAYALLLPFSAIPYSKLKLTQKTLMCPFLENLPPAKQHKIMEGIRALISKGIIKGELLSNTTFTIEPSSFEFNKKEIFSILYMEDIATLVLAGQFTSVKYLCYLIGTVNKKFTLKDQNNFLGFQAISTIAEITGLSATTVIKYNKILEKHKIIYFKRTYKHNNLYGYYQYKNLIQQATINIDVW